MSLATQTDRRMMFLAMSCIGFIASPGRAATVTEDSG
ncbi:MAG: hypothetical protein JWO25_3635, partial [Alphaproteobacteria bacterium]|nr:hypothetical protein [Alphaproteobacteria bacterium]